MGCNISGNLSRAKPDRGPLSLAHHIPHPPSRPFRTFDFLVVFSLLFSCFLLGFFLHFLLALRVVSRVLFTSPTSTLLYSLYTITTHSSHLFLYQSIHLCIFWLFPSPVWFSGLLGHTPSHPRFFSSTSPRPLYSFFFLHCATPFSSFFIPFSHSGYHHQSLVTTTLTAFFCAWSSSLACPSRVLPFSPHCQGRLAPPVRSLSTIAQ